MSRARPRPLPLLTLAGLILAGCKQESETPPATPLATGYQPTAVPTPVPTPVPGGMPAPGPATAPAMSPAFGFFCATDNDAQCPFARCVGGRCGGCTSVAECKPNTQCLPTLVGQLCVPGAAPTPASAPASPGATTPGHASTPPPSVPVPATPAATAAAAPFEAARTLCVQRTNEYRARVGVAPVARRADAEPCGDAQARADSVSRTAHGAFGQCRERAQNECPGWPGAPTDVIDKCLAMMFAEGPGSGPAHGHYVNMTDTRYRGVSCGIAAAANGQLWVVQNFYP